MARLTSRRAAAALALAAFALLLPSFAFAVPRPLPPRVLEAFAPARAMLARGANDSAYAALDTLASRAAARRDDTLRVAALFEGGARRAWFGDFAGALPRLEDARTRAWSLRDSTRWVQSSQWLAYTFHSVGRLSEAGALANRMLPAAVALGDRRTEGYLRLAAAYRDLLTGRELPARAGYRRALAILEAIPDAYGACEAMLGLGRTYSVTGPADSANALFARVVRRAEAAHLPRSAAGAYNNLAASEFLVGDPEAAMDTWRLAARTLREAGELSGYLAAGGNVCLALTQLGRFEEARAFADSMLEHIRRTGSPELAVRAQAHVAVTELNAGHTVAAARRYRAALAAGDLSLELRTGCASGLMLVLVPQDSAAAALAIYDSLQSAIAGRVTPAREAEFHGAGAAAALAVGNTARAEAIARLQLALARREGLANDEIGAERLLARTAAARGRQAEARAQLVRAEAVWRTARTRATGLEWRTTLSRSAQIGSAWAEIELGRGVERRRERIASALAAHERMRSALLLELAAGPGGRYAATAPATLESVQHGVLERDELLLAAWTGGERSWLVAVTRDTAVSVPLPATDELARDVDLLRESISADPPLAPAALDAMLADGGRRLLQPVMPLLARCRRVVFVPAGALQRLPLEALRVPLGRGGALVSLGESRAVSRAPSASLLALARSRRRPAGAADPALLVLANPRGPLGKELPEALAEGRELESRYRGARLLERPRDPEAALRAMAGAGAVHVAAHAGFDPVSPWRSTLQLGDGEPVRARDVLGVRLRSELVVLSACETAGGSARGTGGMEGLGAAFLCVGARGVVATLWPVEDRAARRFVEIFYEEAEHAPDAATALTRARVRYRSSVSGAPVRDWAAFTLVGDPSARLALVRRSPHLPRIP